MHATWIAAVLMGWPLPNAQNVQLDVNVKNGDVLSVEKTFVVKVVSKNPVNQVEFYVGDDLRETDSSTPYEFHFDALSEPEGELKLKFAAYASDGESASKTITVRVDNGISQGADFHVQKAQESLIESKWDEAIRASRIALKAKPGFNPARVAMARAYLGKGVLDQAQKYAEDAVNADPSLSEASSLLIGIHLKKAFTTFHRSGEQKETLAVIGQSFKQAVRTRKRLLDDMLDKMPAPTDATAVAYADSAIRAGRYSAAITALTPAFRRDSRQHAVANRLAFAQMRSGRFQDALVTLAENQRQGGLDAYGFALLGVLKTLAGDFDASDDALRQAVLSDSENLGVRTAQAFLAIQRGRTTTLRNLAVSLAKEEGQRSDVNYYLAAMYSLLGEYMAARDAFERSVQAEPANADMFVLRGNESVRLATSGRLESGQVAYHIAAARMFYEVALEARPESAEALTGIAIVNMVEKKYADALRFARAAVAASPGYAAGHYTLSLVTSALEADLRAEAERIQRAPKDGVLTSEQREQFNKMLSAANEYGKEAKTASDLAGRLDPINLQGREIPKGNVAYDYFSRYGRIPLMAEPK
jgi:tetratricopeptide (TPR) repeat protein